MRNIILKLFVLETWILVGCQSRPQLPLPPLTDEESTQIEVKQFLPTAFLVVHHLPTRQFNSLLVEMDNGELVLVDSPLGDHAVNNLIAWAQYRFGRRKLTCIVTSHAWERAGGTGRLLEAGVVVYGSDRFAKFDASAVPSSLGIADARVGKPTRSFPLSRGTEISFGKQSVLVRFPGVGFTDDNLVVHIPHLQLLYAGGLVTHRPKPVGLVGTSDWMKALRGLRKFSFRWLVPAEGRRLSPELIDNTLSLLDSMQTES